MIFPKPRGGPESSLQRFSSRNVLSDGDTISPKTILVLDDDISIRNVFYWILEQTHRVLTAATGDEAITLCQDQKETIGLLVTDVGLRSAISGTQVAVRVRESCPDLPILLTSGTPPEGWREQDFADLKTLMSGRVDFLQKPFAVRTLTDKIERLTDREFSISGMEKLYAEAETYRRGLRSSAGIRQS